MKVIICPCCGFEFEGNLRQGCEACGARAVGDPLPKPAHVLPAYGRPLLLVMTGVLMFLSFLAETIFSLFQRPNLSFAFWSWLAAAETAAWRLKWIFVPVIFVVLWGGRRIYKSMSEAPARFVGLRAARHGLMASALVGLLIATLIGVAVPERLRHRRMSIEAGLNAQGYTIDRALLEYRARYGTLPAELKDLKDVPDPDGSIATALASTDPTGYKPSADLAALPKGKSRTLRGAVIRNASANSATDDTPDGVVSFTNYELPLPGEDGITGTDDDLILRDGVIMKASEVTKPTTLTAAPVRTSKP